MDTINTIMATQLTEREVMIFMLIEGGMSYRALGQKLGVSHTNVQKTYEKAREKINKFGEMGLFQSPVDK